MAGCLFKITEIGQVKKKKEQKKVNIYLTYSLHGKHFPEYNIVSLRIVRFHLLEIHIKHITV